MIKRLRFFNSTHFIVLIAVAVQLSACNDAEKNGKTYFGGQIINPKSDMVYLYHKNEVLDSAKLDNNNKFLIALDSVFPGIYSFKHYNEIQYLFLEPKDSVLLRLNTWDFDESLVFSGKGAERNNFLINMFLINEKDDKQFLSYYQLPDSLFEKKVDSSMKIKMSLFELFKEEVVNHSPLFDKVALASIQYPLYKQKEAYPYLHEKAIRVDSFLHSAPSFYKYRKSIDFNDPDLAYYNVTMDYTKEYLNHLAYEKQLVEDTVRPYVLNFIDAVLKNVKNADLKNNLLYETTFYAILNENVNANTKEKIKTIFSDNVNNEKYINDIEHIIKISEELPVNSKLPDISLLNAENKVFLLQDLLKDKYAVVYTWPVGSQQLENFGKRIKYLEKNYPDILFIGINAKNSEAIWRNFISENELDTNYQFMVSEPAEWLNTKFSRAILIDNHGIVRNNLTYLSGNKFINQLKKLKNQ